MKKRHVLTLAACVAVLGASGIAQAHHPEGNESHGWDDYDPVDGPRVTHDEKAQHGGDDGHLPASSRNVQLVGTVELTGVPGGIADVGYHNGYAYLNAFSPECAGRPGAGGTGVHVVDISDPANPSKVGFLQSEPNSYQGEGIHVITLDGHDLLVHNNETCDSSQPVTSGFAVWDVTNPVAPLKLGQFGDTTPAVANQTYHTTHSVQAFTWQGKAYAVAQDNQDLKDVDIFDITPTLTGDAAVMVSEVGLEDWPEAQGSYANGDTVFHHDMQQKVIDGHNFLLASYWDAGQVLLNIDDPANPAYVTDSNYSSPDPEQPAFAIPEGNSHQSYFDQNGEYVLSTDEDFSPTRTLCRIETGDNAGETGCGEFGFTPDLGDAYPDGFTGTTVWGGSGCATDADGNGTPDRDELAPAEDTGAEIAVFSRGACFFSDKIRTGELKGYEVVAVGQSHGGTRAGLLPDAFICGGQGSPIDGTAPSICIGHRAMHDLFDDPPGYAGAEFADLPPVSTVGHDLFARGGVFDGWGYVHLHQNTTGLPVMDTYAVPEGQDSAFQEGFGNMTVHEVKTDPREGKDLAYFSYYDAGLRVAKFGPDGITEIGHYVAEGGNDFWGVYPACGASCLNAAKPGLRGGKAVGQNPLLLMSDRDSGLWIFRYSGT
ncbi:MAG: LVIVD repeat-containing protein [Actinomycetota bacterium]